LIVVSELGVFDCLLYTCMSTKVKSVHDHISTLFKGRSGPPFYEKLVQYLRVLLHSEVEAEDIVANSLLKLWERKSDFENATRDKVNKWLFQVSKRAAIDYLIKKRRWDKFYREVGYLHPIAEGLLPDTEKEEIMDGIMVHFKKLPSRSRRFLILSIFEGLSANQIMKNTGLAYTTVISRKSEGLKMLRDRIGRISNLL